jgi:uncharacterized lipoprotein YmbA
MKRAGLLLVALLLSGCATVQEKWDCTDATRIYQLAVGARVLAEANEEPRLIVAAQMAERMAFLNMQRNCTP